MTRGFWRKNGLKNGARIYLTTNFGPAWAIVGRMPKLRSTVNRFLINRMVYTMPTRPLGLSTYEDRDYRSWPGLTDRTWSARHLPGDDQFPDPPPEVATVVGLFERPAGREQVSAKSTLLFPHFAQWFVDGFLRTDPANARKNTSTHEIDLSQLYGQTTDVTDALRRRDEQRPGELKSQTINGQEFPPYYFGADGQPKEEFANLPITYPGGPDLEIGDRKTRTTSMSQPLSPEKRKKLFALGIPRGNIHYGLVMMSTLFLREHNSIAQQIAAAHEGDPKWNDDRVFETTRNTLTAVLLRVVIEDYINHITPIKFKLFVESGIGAGEKWYRQNWMSVEFNLLYRWHTMIPSSIRVGGEDRNVQEVLWDTDLVTTNGLSALFDEASAQPCTAVGLLNTDPALLDIEQKSIEIGRETKLASFNAYRQRCGYPKLKSFEDLSSDPSVQSALKECYGEVDNVELYPGLFAEDVRKGGILPTLMATMVAVDAFSQALTNPLLAPGIFGRETFSETGLEIFTSTKTLADIVARNIPGELPNPRVDFNQERRSIT
ncbi:peroxidase family protein [Mycobacterium sp.]|uniref:peroxidase family protein n=1 Tax=Mycobacterium sp. TaxID=1785 RepID=UPI002DA1416B|nr:peroxidase family protein [Mycobacterium sp.]